MSVETDEFAAMLRELKDRSGRSYGTLAARLHVSTSTLHRYCNGAAVPNEYAPVERLARVCGASADELVTLHRRWILADAARRREPVRATPPAEPAVEPRPAPAAPTPPADETPPASTSQTPQTPHPASGTPEPPDSVDVLNSAHRPAGEPRRRRLPYPRILLSAVAVAVVAAAIPLLVPTGGHGDTPRTAQQPPAGPAAPASASPSAPATAPATAPASATSPPATSAPTPTPTAKASDDPAPFHVNVLTDNWGSPCDQWFLSAKPPRSVPAPPTTKRTDSWAAAQEAVPAGHLRLQLTAQGESATPVVLHALYVQVVSTRPAPKGNAYTMGSGCGGSITPAAFSVDLDAAAPRPVPVPAQEGEVKSRTTSNFPYTVSASDPQVLNIDAGTAGQDVGWTLELVWSSGDRQGVLPVNDHGKPFRTVGMKGAPSYFYQDERTGWAPDRSGG
ncbi:helix-turn-helix transcriptional regulator [Kitasatospora sp. NPDC050463]|uniref:helix-turn-helix domain-containing protein n=1 Tax=Kitasatospora sp. NPDC050463 TaxID=3155786 RepID=UPI0033ECAE5A